MRSLAFLLLLPWIASAPLLENCEYCKPKRICSVHKEEEKETLRELRGALQAEGESERLAALERAAALTREHSNAPSKQVADFLAAGLADRSLAVRARAAALLADGQEPETAVGALVAGLADVKKELERAEKTASEEALAAASDYGSALLAALGRLADDRSVRALTGFLDKLRLDGAGARLAPAACSALCTLGSREAVAWVVASLPSLERPEAATEALTALAARLDLGPAPEGVEHDAWRSWLEAAKDKLPARLGKLRVQD